MDTINQRFPKLTAKMNKLSLTTILGKALRPNLFVDLVTLNVTDD